MNKEQDMDEMSKIKGVMNGETNTNKNHKNQIFLKGFFFFSLLTHAHLFYTLIFFSYNYIFTLLKTINPQINTQTFIHIRVNSQKVLPALHLFYLCHIPIS